MSTVPYRRPTPPLQIDQPLPQHIEAERSVLGAILLDNSALKAVAQELKPQDFFHDHHRRIYSAMMLLFNSEQAIDLVTLTDELQRANLLDSAGGAAYIAQLTDGVPHVANVAYHARIVKDKAALRELIHAANLIQQEALAGIDPPEEILERASASVSQVAKIRERTGLVAVDVRDFLLMDLPPLEYAMEPLLTLKGRGMVYAPRGAGKTFITMQIAHSIAAGTPCFVWNIPQPRPVIYVDGEMHSSMLQERQREILKINGSVPPDAGFLRLITRDLQKDVRPKINTKSGRDHLEAHLSKGDVLILDNLSALSPSSDEKETEDWALIEDWLSDLSWHGITTIFVNHSGKSGDQRGTSKREDLLDFVLKLRVPSDHTMDEGLRAELHLTKLRGKSPKPVWGRPFEVRLGIDEHGDLTWLTRELKELLKDRARTMLSDGMKTNDVVMETGLSRWAVARLAKNLKHPGSASEE